MISLSRIIKSSLALQEDINRKIEIQRVMPKTGKLDDRSCQPDARSEADALLQEIEREYQEAKQKMEQERLQHEEFLLRSKEEWQQQVIAERENARQTGYQEGFSAGEIEGRTTYENLLTMAKTTVDRSKEDYLRYLESAEPMIIELASKMARKLVGDVLTENPEAWKELVRRLLNEVREHPDVKLYVHPKWYETTQNAKQEIQQVLMHSATLFIYPDFKLNENNCVVEFPFGKIEAGLDSQLNELKKKLIETLGEHHAEHE
ncbi:flagellar assembly protein FliH [Fictibacillus sp. S7]|nr:flagellar assembly protein FliH [Fictibacillus sp. S7]